MGRNNPLQDVAERLGFMAYVFAVSAGQVDWQTLMVETSYREPARRNALRDTVPATMSREASRS